MGTPNVSLFKFHGADVRSITKDDGSSWFVLKDQCDILGLRVTDVVDRLNADEVDSIYLTDSTGREQEMYIVNEPGLYQVVLLSRKPEAKEFKRWITHEVLPQIRKTGTYQKDMSPAQMLHQLTGWMVEQELREREQSRKIQLLEVRADYETSQNRVVEKIQAIEWKHRKQLEARLQQVENYLHADEDDEIMPAILYIKEHYPIMRPWVNNPNKETHNNEAERNLASAYSRWVTKYGLLSRAGLQEDKRRFGTHQVHHYPVWFLKMTFPIFLDEKAAAEIAQDATAVGS